MPKSSNHNSDVHGVHQMVHSTFQCYNFLLCPKKSNHDDAILGVNHLVQSICNFVKQMCMFPGWRHVALHGHSQAQSMQEGNAKTCSVKLQYNTICLF